MSLETKNTGTGEAERYSETKAVDGKVFILSDRLKYEW